MRRFKNPVCVFGVRNGLVPPFDLEMAGCLFEERRSGEAVHVEFGLWRHLLWVGWNGWVEVGGLRGQAVYLSRM